MQTKMTEKQNNMQDNCGLCGVKIAFWNRPIIKSMRVLKDGHGICHPCAAPMIKSGVKIKDHTAEEAKDLIEKKKTPDRENSPLSLLRNFKAGRLKVALGFVAAFLIFSIALPTPEKKDNQSDYEQSISNPVGRWAFDDIGGWHFELRIFSTGKYIFEGPPGTDIGSWTQSGSDVTFYLKGMRIATGYRSGNSFIYNTGSGTIEMSIQ